MSLAFFWFVLMFVSAFFLPADWWWLVSIPLFGFGYAIVREAKQ